MNDEQGISLHDYPMWGGQSAGRLSAVRHQSTERGADRRSSRDTGRIAPARRGINGDRWNTDYYNTNILPIQFFTESGSSCDFSSGTQRLMFAVLQDAVACWFRLRDCRTSRRRRLFQETYEWFWTRTPQGLYAFEHICEVLNLDPGYIRRGLQPWLPDAPGQEIQRNTQRPQMLTRRSAVPFSPVLHVPQMRTKKASKLQKQKE